MHPIVRKLTRIQKIEKKNLKATKDFPGDPVVMSLPANAGNTGVIPGPGRSSVEGNGSPLQYFCLENPMDKGAWQAIIHGIAKSGT